ncbi:MAG: hypothetical protein WBE76_06210 [Terracidiphilus sp.]
MGKEAIKFSSVARDAKNDLPNLNDRFCAPLALDPCCELLGKTNNLGERVCRIPVENGFACLCSGLFGSGRLSNRP